MAKNTKKEKVAPEQPRWTFGEMDSSSEINKAAEGFLNEGDLESLKKLADENGIEPDDVQDYIDGVEETLTNDYTAAVGKIKEEIAHEKNMAKRQILQVIGTLAKEMCTEQEFAKAVRKKGKKLESVHNALKEGARQHKSGDTGCSCGTDRQLYGIIEAYYKEGKAAAKKKVDALYEVAG